MDVRSFLETRGHAAALSVSAVLFAAVAAHAALGHEEERDAVALRATAARAAVASNPAPIFGKPDYSTISAAWSPSAVAAPDGKRAYVSSSKTRVVANVIGKPRIGDKPIVLPAAPAPEASVVPGRVSLRWSPVVKGAGVATVSEIRVLRRGPGDIAAAVVATLKADATAWEDANVKPRAEYEYWLQISTAQVTKDGRRESDSSAATQATCPAGADIRFTGGSDGAAFVIVRKWIDGEWLEQSFSAWPRNEENGRGGEIGRVIVRNGKQLDFACGFTLLAIRREIRRFTVPWEERRIVNGVIVARKMRREMSRECLRVEFTDDAGATRKIWKEGDLPENAEPLGENDK